MDKRKRGKAYFISDLHLGATYGGGTREAEKLAVGFLDSIKYTAAEIFLLGDILDYWFEYREVVPRGYVRFFGKLAELTDSGVKVTWLIGNHDIWIFDYIPSELGVEVVDGVLRREVLGVEMCMQHGDAIGGSHKFRFLRSLFRNKFCQRLYSGVHPRWTVGFAHGCSRRSRMGGGSSGSGPGGHFEAFRKWCEEQIRLGDKSRFYIFGHLHRLVEEILPDDRKMVVLPAFPGRGEYGIFDGKTFKIEAWHDEKTPTAQ